MMSKHMRQKMGLKYKANDTYIVCKDVTSQTVKDLHRERVCVVSLEQGSLKCVVLARTHLRKNCACKSKYRCYVWLDSDRIILCLRTALTHINEPCFGVTVSGHNYKAECTAAGLASKP